MPLLSDKALAYVNFGRWIADCPMDCGSALQLTNGQGIYQCIECGFTTEILWPNSNVIQEIWEALGERPAKRNRNWFPEDHPLALRSMSPHGQTPQELRDETEENRRV